MNRLDAEQTVGLADNLQAINGNRGGPFDGLILQADDRAFEGQSVFDLLGYRLALG